MIVFYYDKHFIHGYKGVNNVKSKISQLQCHGRQKNLLFLTV